ncbi:MAG: hypothetical protein FWC09_02670 [Lachnospiraceae bacterium]|nr:hypothetical protein [Lachnospiraceae bacterium]
MIEMFRPFPFENNSEQCVYAQLIIRELKINEDGYENVIVDMSLINNTMIDYEVENCESNKNSPRYFYEFTGQSIWDNHYYDIKDIYYPYLCIKKMQLGEYNNEIMHKVRIIPIKEDEEIIYKREFRKSPAFYGEILFSASPIIARKAIIIIEDICETPKQLKRIYDVWNSSIHNSLISDANGIELELNNVLNYVNNLDVNIYNVGQANCIYLKMNNEIGAFFDIGITRSMKCRDKESIEQSLKEISGLDAKLVILSHWDLDHILGISYAHESLNDCVWVAPNFLHVYNNVSMSVKRLCNYLVNSGAKLLLVDESFSNRIVYRSPCHKIEIWKGVEKSVNNISKANNSGLILKLSLNKKFLFLGDCENSVVPNRLRDSYEYVMISHHGSKMSNPNCLLKMSAINSCAYVSYGEESSGNFHLNDNLEDEYKKLNYRLKKTCDLDFDNVKYKVSLL